MTTARYLNFHGMGIPGRPLEPGESDLWIDPDRFVAIVQVVSSRPEIHLTFDDANASDHEHALPVLVDHDLHATFFLIAGRLDEPGSLSRSQVLEIADQGMSIGTHGMRHVSWRALSPAQRQEELVAARSAIEDLVQRPVREASLPFGQYDGTVKEHLLRARYERAMTSDGYWSVGSRLLVPRRSIRRTDTPAVVEDLVSTPPRMLPRTAVALKQLVKARL